MKIYIGADHNGFDYKQSIVKLLLSDGHEVIDCGGLQQDPDDDFPKYAALVTREILDDPKSTGLLICGSGQGMCIAANRFKGVRASLCWSRQEAKAARNDDDSNILCLSSRYTSLKDAESIIQAWLTTPFAGAPRFKRRIRQLDELT